MKKSIKILSGICVCIASAAAAIAFLSSEPDKIVLPKDFTLTAHTGCEGTSDNSLEAITKGYESGADIVEFDVRFTSDGTPILSHDETDEANVTLLDALSLVAKYDDLKVNLDIKTTNNLPAVLNTVKGLSLENRVFYTGIEKNDVAVAKRDTPEIIYYLNTEVPLFKRTDAKFLNALADEVIACGAVGINMNYKNCTQELVDIFHEKGLLVSVWTVNGKSAMRKILSLGVDNITTRKPSELKAIINEGV